jgi:hypothetical protein
MLKIYISHDIELPNELKPSDVVRGVLYLDNRGKKGGKLKKIFARVVERWEKWESYEDEDGNHFTDWFTRKKKRSEVIIDNFRQLAPGEKKQFEFAVELPPKWKAKESKTLKIRGWHMVLLFYFRSGIITQQGMDHNGAECILPVIGSQVEDLDSQQAIKAKMQKQQEYQQEFAMIHKDTIWEDQNEYLEAYRKFVKEKEGE